MTPFISGPVLQVHLDTTAFGKEEQSISNTITYWKIINVMLIDSSNDQNIHWAREQIFSVLLIPDWVEGLDKNMLDDFSKIKLQRTYNPADGTESWKVV